MAQIDPIYELFGLPGNGKTTTARETARAFPHPTLHEELLRQVERFGSDFRISLRFDLLECRHFLAMARAVDRPIDRVQRRKIWQAEKNCLEYSL